MTLRLRPRSEAGFFSPAELRRIAEAVLPAASLGCALMLPYALYLALVVSPPDYYQGEAVRMMYVHVPSAWIALGAYVLMAVFCLIGLFREARAMFTAARAAAVPGAVFCFLCLATGSLWGKPVWGTWWVWDARLTSMLVLFFFYVSYSLLLRSYPDPEKGERLSAMLCVLGVINVPVVKFSVEWWRTLHQPSGLFRAGGSSVHPAMMTPLLWMFGAFSALAVTAGMLRFLTLLDQQKSRRLERRRISELTRERA